ncbi:MAG TPA: helical backbone metal receptor [Pyrinomonadaceae bacterium]|nr:helical backbone metal receptor [Pyrinomonadaceae bacterium]
MRDNKSRVCWFSAVAFALVLLSNCTNSPPKMEPQQTQPTRIVSISPSVTEILYAIGSWPDVVAVSEYCTYPADVVNKPRVSGWGSTNLEQITALKPDIVIGVDAQEAFLRDKLNAIGVHSIFVKSQTLADIYEAIEQIGKTVGHAAEAAELAAHTRNEVEQVRAALADRPRRRVLCVVDRVPGTLRDIYVATRGSFLDEMVAIAGGEPIAPTANSGYGKITKEAVLSLDPEVIVDMVQTPKGRLAENPMQVWRELSEVSAVQTGRVFSMGHDTAIHPSQFVAPTTRRFAHYIHPEVFPTLPD